MDKDKKYQFSRWIGNHLSDETIESKSFEEWMWCSDRYDPEELKLMKDIFNNRKRLIEEAKIEAAKPEEDTSFTYHATAYRFYDCPSCDGEDDEAEIMFANSLDELMKYSKEYKYDRIYRNGNMIARCEYDIGTHRVHKVKLCNLDMFWEADSENIIKIY